MAEKYQTTLTALGALFGWTMTLTAADAASIFAAAATALWMVTQSILAFLPYKTLSISLEQCIQCPLRASHERDSLNGPPKT